jgi:hypothetical protein
MERSSGNASCEICISVARSAYNLGQAAVKLRRARRPVAAYGDAAFARKLIRHSGTSSLLSSSDRATLKWILGTGQQTNLLLEVLLETIWTPQQVQ